MHIRENTVVLIDYRLTNDAEELIDSSDEHGPLGYIHGHGNIIPGLEQALEGRAVGDNFKASIEPSMAYGEKNPALTQTLPSSMFGGVDQIAVGMQFHAQTDHGVEVVTVTSVEAEQVTIDGNHPLAGQTLHFEVTVREVREAQAEEIEHGHVHGEHGHHH
ncbi:MAG: peptidylprolyl isomerase [Halothiobacillaceae bacterium]|nr:MAG: peptidylprolyl isomerase [Halothiobacillaceae bacterium]